MITTYISIVVAVMALIAARARDMDSRSAFWISILWPVSIMAAILVLAFSAAGWAFDIKGGKSYFGLRSPNDGWPGIAITLFGMELMFWKKRIS